jgi:hypothetical protein
MSLNVIRGSIYISSNVQPQSSKLQSTSDTRVQAQFMRIKSPKTLCRPRFIKLRAATTARTDTAVLERGVKKTKLQSMNIMSHIYYEPHIL